MKKTSILISAVLIFTLLLSACESKDTEKITENAEVSSQETITLKIGTHGSFRPYAFIDENADTPQGYEIDLMNKIAKRKNLDVSLEAAEWNGVFGMLDAGQLDTIACVVSPTDERREKYDFSEPYIKMDIGIGVQKGQAASIAKLEDLAGKKIDINAGG